MKELLKYNIEEINEEVSSIEISFFSLKEDKKLNDGDIISDALEIVVLLQEGDDICGLVGYNISSKKIIWVKSDEITTTQDKCISFEISELRAIKKIFNGDIF